ncbi:hypothetical protein K458DRAFT_393099 [Lentithecium fluviatile CBS 122367]|uniref:Rhodopsin domain-containing protein n=1 Tax=Lentithecium fluviatile CBS 122367 TaxID=1168545 RepID=A0A6G1IPF5_9PLEO|nr:hypothetical protein K458DRAFT_393099 [Lentithecium fluviatile CBS 122367]
MAVEDNGPIIVGVTWFLCFFSGTFLVLRLYAKISRRQGLWWDDHILIFSWTMLLVESVLTQMGQTLGFGKHTTAIPPQNLPLIALGTSIAASISCFASTFSKISFGVTLLRLTTGPLRACVWFCIITLFLVMLPSALLTWISCRPMAKAWNSLIEGECWDGRVTVGYGIFNAGWCAATDFALALIPWKLVWGLRLRTREKVGVAVAMSMGMLAGVCAIVKGVYLVQLAQQDFFYNGKDVTIWTAVETATAIVGASIPVLRVFFKDTISSLYNHTAPISHSDPKSSSIPLSDRSGTRSGTRGIGSTVRGRGDSASERSILRDTEDLGVVIEENGRMGRKAGLGGILQTRAITVEYERRSFVSGFGGGERGEEEQIGVAV